MVKRNDILVKVELKKGEEKLVDLGRIYPLGKIEYKGNVKIDLSHDGKKYFNKVIDDSLEDETARYIKFKSGIKQTVTVRAGLGYYAVKNEEFEKHFVRRHHWTGADGIYSFNLENKEDYNQQNDKTLFVFGDTFVGQVNEQGNRLEPTAMVNNTFGYYHNGKIDFEVAKGKFGEYKSLFVPTAEMQKKGYDARNLTMYLGEVNSAPFISEMDFGKDIEIIFHIHGVHHVNKIGIENFRDEPEFGATTTDRGVNCLDVYSSNDGVEYKYEQRFVLEKYSPENTINFFDVNIDAKYIKFIIPYELNGNDSLKEDKIVGLKKVYFFNHKGLLYDVTTTANSSFFGITKNNWFWLQDGIIKDNTLHIYPCIIEEDLNGIEGYEFKMTGVAYLKLNIIDGKIDYDNVKMRNVPLYRFENNREYMLPIAIYQEEEYAYFYGYYYERTTFVRHLIVSRIPVSKITDLNNLEYYDGKNWVTDMNKAKSILTHVSCEMSVQKIVEGENKGKYLAVFQYDTNGPQVAYSIGESVVGPFGKPRIVYVTEEVENYNKGTTYTYNAKAHLHLSSPRNILVSYNCNDMLMKKNKEDYSIYHPRFLNLLDTSND